MLNSLCHRHAVKHYVWPSLKFNSHVETYVVVPNTKVMSFDCSAPGNDKSYHFFLSVLSRVDIVGPKFRVLTVVNLRIMKLGKSHNFKPCLNFLPKFWLFEHSTSEKDESWQFSEFLAVLKFWAQNSNFWPLGTCESRN